MEKPPTKSLSPSAYVRLRFERSTWLNEPSFQDVDFNSAFLCGYLCIRGLTPEFPQLTTYFDSEIIGSRHGFLTPNALAEEQDDIRHWQRFPPFRHVKHELRQPRLTIPDRDRGAVFMRWKERFLVDDPNRIEKINGASFEGSVSLPIVLLRSQRGQVSTMCASTSTHLSRSDAQTRKPQLRPQRTRTNRP